MSRRVCVAARYDVAPDDLFRQVRDFGDLQDAMAGFGEYRGLPTGLVDAGQSMTVDVTLFGFLKNKGHQIVVERVDTDARELQSRERGKGIRRWDHLITVTPDGDGAIWSDAITIDAGWKTGLVARFAVFMYIHRHSARGGDILSRKISKV